MSQADVLVEADADRSVFALSLGELGPGLSFREGELCDDQVDKLVSLGGAWPPILVSVVDWRVIDGAHRVEAARRLGLARIEVELFDGSSAAAFEEFLRRNVAHGLMLTLSERKQATRRVLDAHPDWSDRRVAELCGISPKTVGRLRPDSGSSVAASEVREGRDLRVRPVQRGPVRARVAEALRARPTASLRVIAAEVGVSPETVRQVRLNLDASVHAPLVPSVAAVEPVEWRADPALASSERAEEFLGWFERTVVADGDLSWVASVPLSRVYIVAEAARQRADTWLSFARALEARPAGNR